MLQSFNDRKLVTSMALFSLAPWALALLLLGAEALPITRGRVLAVYGRVARFPVSAASELPPNDSFAPDQAARDWVRDCPCSHWHPGPSASRLCLPVAWASPERRDPRKKEVFAFSIATDDRWKRYDWDLVRSF